MRKLTAQQVSRRLRAAGHRLVYPDRKRDGVSVRQFTDVAVSVQASFCTPYVEMPQLLGELVTTLINLGYAIQLEHQGSREYAVILVRRPDSQKDKV